MAGDAADDAFDAAMDEWLREDHDDDEVDPMDGMIVRRHRCKFCEQGGLKWFRVKREDGSAQWRLGDPATEKLHTCVAYREAKAIEDEEPGDIPF